MWAAAATPKCRTLTIKPLKYDKMLISKNGRYLECMSKRVTVVFRRRLNFTLEESN